MARKPRIEYAGACYHVINRGNFRQDLFTQPGTAEAFERTLFEACERCGWELGGYVIMSNHYHLAICTPKGNLVQGVQWLQSTFANRFNRYFREMGHVFQGRYRAILVEPGEAFARVVTYIHLNPVRAGIVGVDDLEKYAWSSFVQYQQKKSERAECLVCEDWLNELGGLRDTALGWKKYRDYLKYVNELEPKEKEKLFGRMCRGWVLGSEEFKKEMRKEFVQMSKALDWGGAELRELNEEEWEQEVTDCLNALGKGETDIRDELKSAEWKSTIGWYVKKRTSVNNRWLAERLNMGRPAMVLRLCGAFSRQPQKVQRSCEKRFTAKSKG